MSGAPHDPDAGLEPAFAAPANACDAHFHVFGPEDRYGYDSADLRYRPPHAPLEDYLALARRLGLSRFVFVQPSAYGMDNSCMLDAMRTMGTAVCRGIVHLDEQTATDIEIAELDGLGVRGVRINVSPVRKPEAGLADHLRPRIEHLAARLREVGWHIDFLLPGWLVTELLPTLAGLPVPFSVAHMGLFPAAAGPGQPGFQQLLRLAADGSRRVWVKLTGIYRFSTQPGFTDVEPFARALIETVPDQIIWGSDYPHLSFHDKVGTIQLYNLLGRWAPEPVIRRKILADNPQHLFGF
ncbi:MAG: amidohydrolase [Acetobacteraceae bacterium]